MIIVLIIILLLCIVWACIQPFECESNEGIETFRSDVFEFNSLTQKALKFMRGHKVNTLFFDDKQMLDRITKTVNDRLGTNFRSSDRSLWLRYYDSKSKNPYEEYHYDRQRYCRKSNQIRVVVVLVDDSDSHFCYKLRCKDNSEICIPSKVGNWSVVYANRLLHAAKVRNGERLVLMADLVDDTTKGVCGWFFTIWDYIWLQWFVHLRVGKVIHIPDFTKNIHTL